MQTLKDRILAHIKTSGPMNIANYMSWCLLDPKQGYYPTRDPLGITKEGKSDFITAPEISQMFGEVLGLWLIHAWRSMGEPKTVQLVEYGPGRGVMMSDMLRTARLDKGFFAALNVSLIETSAALEGKQAETLANCGVAVSWANKLEDVPKGPTIVIGNEYLDCLPIRQLIMKDRFKGAGGWHERMVDIHPDNPEKLVFSVSDAPLPKADQALLPGNVPDLKDGDLLEISPGLAQMTETLSWRFSDHPGAALFIDYGPEATELGDSFQALKKHKKVYPLDEPGQADLTARVDFAVLSERAGDAGLSVYGPCPQGQFLSRLGIEVRAVSLSKSLGAKSAPDAKAKIARQLHRITNADEMGVLFKAIAVQSPNLPAPLGFNQ
ncbi:MAG: SAM-dependent methyltransferase [Robiginitomaculum sp.]|nr:SAM-dependent methyltransferase [Robiginitomaculum sp.]